MMISSKNVYQNMLIKFFIFLKKFTKLWRFRLQIPVGLRRLGALLQTPLPREILPTPTVLLQNVLSLSPFLMKVLRGKF